MPDELDGRLRTARETLLAEIGPPDMGQVTRRAGTLRRRRTATRLGGLALACVVVAGVLSLQPWGKADGGGPEVAATPTPYGGPVYADTEVGITVNGMVRDYANPAGSIVDVEFTDPDRGFALLADCTPDEQCRHLTVAATADGGLTWQLSMPPYPMPVVRPELPDLMAYGTDRLVLAGAQPFDSVDGGRTWRPVPVAVPHLMATAPAGARLRVPPGCGPVQVWTFGSGHDGDLANQPPIRPCWTNGEPAAGGVWWVGGIDLATGAPAVAVTRDAGKTWQRPELPGSAVGAAPMAWVQVSTLGAYAYAYVVGPDGQLGAIYRSVDQGQRFTRTRDGIGVGLPHMVSGEAVPMLDGRLLIASAGRWFVSEDDGATFRPGNNLNLPAVGRLARTPAGYVALDLFGTGWSAYSSDGSTWRKLHLN